MPQSGFYRKTTDLGYWLNERYWGRGIMPAVVQHLIDCIVTGFPGQLTRLNGKHFTRNSASGRVFEKCVFVFEVVLRRIVLDRNGQIQD